MRNQHNMFQKREPRLLGTRIFASIAAIIKLAVHLYACCHYSCFIEPTVFSLREKLFSEAKKMVGATEKRFRDTRKMVLTRKNTFLAAENIICVTRKSVSAVEKMVTVIENTFRLSKKPFSASQKRFSVAEKRFRMTQKVVEISHYCKPLYTNHLNIGSESGQRDAETFLSLGETFLRGFEHVLRGSECLLDGAEYVLREAEHIFQACENNLSHEDDFLEASETFLSLSAMFLNGSNYRRNVSVTLSRRSDYFLSPGYVYLRDSEDDRKPSAYLPSNRENDFLLHNTFSFRKNMFSIIEIMFRSIQIIFPTTCPYTCPKHMIENERQAFKKECSDRGVTNTIHLQCSIAVG
jgi:hypothetical protein